MGELFRIDVVYSTQHWIFPTIIIVILAVLGLVILVTEGLGRVKAGKGFLTKPGRFFVENYDKVKLWGCVVLMAAYFFLLDKIGFTVCSILFVFLFNTLFAGPARMKNVKYHLVSLLISVVSVLLISILFGTVFDITLPSGVCTIWIKDLGITIF